MNYLTPPEQSNDSSTSNSPGDCTSERRAFNSSSNSSGGSGSGSTAQRLTSRSASPGRRVRTNSLTPIQDAVDLSPLASPQPVRKRPPRPAQLNEIFRPRCNTDPSRHPSNDVGGGSSKKPTASRSVLGSLLRQTLKVTTASVGLSASEERLTQLATNGLLNDNAKQKHSRSSSSIACPNSSTSSHNNNKNKSKSNNNCSTDERSTSCLAGQRLPGAGQAGENPSAAASVSEQQQQLQQQQQQQHQLYLLRLRRQQYAAQKLSPEHSSLPQTFNSYIGPLQPSGSVHDLGSSTITSAPNQSGQGESQASGTGTTAGRSGGNTAKQHDQQASAAAAAAAAIPTASAAAAADAGVGAVNAGVGAASAAAGSTVTATAPVKEKKRKEVSSSRVKKFLRHFSQVSKDEILINYFSCALVGDIPLQGHLYITKEHFAFYSNVFGYVTKVVIPTSSVTRISKEKTVKIIPNAVGVATADERHVFGSFMSRDSAFRLMCSVCGHLNTGAEILPKALPAYVDTNEEYLNDDDSSCSISGNESPPHLLQHPVAGDEPVADSETPQMTIRQRTTGGDRHSDLQSRNSINLVTIRNSTPPIVHYADPKVGASMQLANGAGSRSASASASGSVASSSGPPSSSSSPVTVVGVTAASPHARPTGGRLRGLLHSARSHLSWRLPAITELHVLYLGILLAILLSLMSVFLLYRILDIEAKTSLYHTPVDFALRSASDEDIFADALRWQKELQDKSAAEAHNILSRNLEQISKVRRSLEALSMLIHDRRAGYAQSEAAAQAAVGTAAGAAAETIIVPDLASQGDVSD